MTGKVLVYIKVQLQSIAYYSIIDLSLTALTLRQKVFSSSSILIDRLIMGVMSDKSDMCMKVQGRFTCHKLVHDGLLNMYISVAGFRPTVYETQTEVFDFGVDGDGRERGRFVVRWEEGREREGRVEGENEEGGGGDGLLIGRLGRQRRRRREESEEHG